jgi:hypothetical protein
VPQTPERAETQTHQRQVQAAAEQTEAVVTIGLLLLDLFIVVVVALLGNEFRLIIDEKDDVRAADCGQHDAATVPNLTPIRIIIRKHERIAEDRVLFERIAYDFECAAMTQPIDRFVVMEGSVAE